MFEQIQLYCNSKPAVTEEFPFDTTTIAWKVAGKIFCLSNINDFVSINLKCEPQLALELREEYWQVKPGYHMNKNHWNTVTLDQLSLHTIYQWIDISYELVKKSLPKKIREEI